MTRRSLHSLFAALALLLFNPQSMANQAMKATSPVALDNVHLIYPDQGESSDLRCVRIEGDHITSISRPGSRRCSRDGPGSTRFGRALPAARPDRHCMPTITLGPLEIRRQSEGPVMIALPD